MRARSLVAVVLAASIPFFMANTCTSDRVSQAERNQGAVKVEHSVERDNINRRLTISNDSTQIMWFYGLSAFGQVIISSPVVGKVTSSTKRLEPTHTSNGSYTTGYVGGESFNTDEIMGADLTYGTSDSYVFWFTPEGNYFQWNGTYCLSNAPVKTATAVLNTRNIDYEELQRGKTAEQALKAGKRVNNNLEVEVSK